MKLKNMSFNNDYSLSYHTAFIIPNNTFWLPIFIATQWFNFQHSELVHPKLETSSICICTKSIHVPSHVPNV